MWFSAHDRMATPYRALRAVTISSVDVMQNSLVAQKLVASWLSTCLICGRQGEGANQVRNGKATWPRPRPVRASHKCMHADSCGDEMDRPENGGAGATHTSTDSVTILYLRNTPCWRCARYINSVAVQFERPQCQQATRVWLDWRASSGQRRSN